jgi:hypothetical protein
MIVDNKFYYQQKFIDNRIKLFKETFTYHLETPTTYVGFIDDKDGILTNIDSFLYEPLREISICKVKGTIFGFDHLKRLNTLIQESVYEKVLAIHLHGWTCEWMKDWPRFYIERPHLMRYTSLQELKKALGFNHFTGDEIVNFFKLPEILKDAILESDNRHQTYKYAIKHYDRDKSYLNDYIRMCRSLGLTVRIPKGKHKLIELHDYMTDRTNEKSLEGFTNDPIVEIVHPTNVNEDGEEMEPETPPNFMEIWKQRGLKFTHINNERDLKLAGIRQKHCIGGYVNKMNEQSFFEFVWDDKRYNLQLYTNGKVGQFYGYRNVRPPEKLKDLVRDDINLEHQIKYKGVLMIDGEPQVTPENNDGALNDGIFKFDA